MTASAAAAESDRLWRILRAHEGPLGDPGRPPIEVLANRCAAVPGDYLTLDDLRACLS